MKLSAQNSSRGKRWHAGVLLIPLLLLMPCILQATTNATANGQWISIGIPKDLYVGSGGQFVMTGTDMGSCAGLVPTYFLSSMSATYWKDLYTLILYSHAQQKPLMCNVDSGCGTANINITYCRLQLQ